MKKSLLIWGLLCFAGSVYAQPIGVGRWTVVNTNNPNTFDTYAVDDIHAVSANVAWGLTYDATVPSPVPAGFRFQDKSFIRTNNAAGTEFDFNSLSDNIPADADFEAANINGIDNQIAVAAMFNGTAAGGGKIYRTANGGQTWASVSGRGFAGPGGFNNWVHMFDANEGVAFGDPNIDANTSVAYFEILRTTNGGQSWTRTPSSSVPARNVGEAGLVRSYFALSGTNTIWAGTGNQDQPNSLLRILKSTDRGVTWTAYPTPLTGQINHIAFKDALNGIAFNTQAGAAGSPGTINVIRTSNGGLTWSAITPITATTGKFYATDIDAVPATASVPGFYVSSGISAVPGAASIPNDALGSSTSIDGVTWKDIDNAILVSATRRRVYLCMDVISNTAGYAGGYFEQGTGAGGVYKVNPVTPLPTRAAALTDKVALTAFPNPSTGLFQVQMEGGVKMVTQLTVTDALGRQVYSRQLSPSTASSEAISVDLTKEKAGVYIMELRNEAGISQKKVVVQ